MTGRPAEAAIGRGLAEVVPDVAAQFEPHVWRALQGERVADLELQGTQIAGVSASGGSIWCRLNRRATRAERSWGAVLPALDITERKQAEKALWDHQERLSNLIEQAAVGIAQVDLQGRLLLVNDRFSKGAGHDREALQGQLMPDITHPDDRPRNMLLFGRLAETGVPFWIEKRYVRPDGSVVWVGGSVSVTR